MTELELKARKVVEGNWRGSFTVPRNKLYPFQWNWDSGFVALGLANYDVEKSIQELNSLFSGQWKNGMIPHIIFHSEHETTYFPNFDFWDTAVNPGAPNKPKTSGITQPPVHGFVLEYVLENNKQGISLDDFVKSIFPQILDYHRFFYKHRDPHQEKLCFIYHPWESGRDNSPVWDESLDRIDLSKVILPKYERQDTKISDASERPTSIQYDLYVYLLELGKKHKYEGPKIFEESPFAMQDCMMNAILIKSNKALYNIAKSYGFDTSEIKEWIDTGMENYDKKFWNTDLNYYSCFDLVSNKQTTYKEIGGLVPLFAKIPDSIKANYLINDLKATNQKGFYLCPSFDLDNPLFDSKRYWRGPVWPHMNWMVRQGLLQYGENTLAEIVKNDTLQLINNQGFYEYFESQKNKSDQLSKGYGGSQFSWTATTIIDLLHD